MLSTFQKAREQEQSSPFKKLNVLLLSSEWWSRKGGISTLNRVLAIQLAKHPLVDVTVFLLECSEEEKKEAFKHNINVFKAKRQPGLEEKVWLCFPPNDIPIDIVIGHGEKLGPPAKIIRDSRRCRWVQIVHTIPKELGMFKTYGNPIIKSEMKHKVEVELGEMADLVIGVGPKLSEAFRCYLRWCKKDPDDVINLTPGIFNEYSNIQHAPQDEKKYRVLVFGRDDEEDFALKGFDITAKAVASLPNTILIFAGACNEDFQKVANRFLECGISPQNLEVRGFLKSTQEFIQLFCEVDLALLPSRSDGFGLTALEALSAGLPVLVSRNTGFGEALSKVPFGSFYVIDSEDPNVWASAIEKVWKKNRATRLQETENLRTFYRQEYKWEGQCNDLVKKFRTIDIDKQEQETTGADVYSNQRGICHRPMQERMESEPSTFWQRNIDQAALCHTTKQQMEDEADSQKQVREEEFARAKKLDLTDQAGLPERSRGGQPPPYVTHEHNLHVQELITREEHSLQLEESVLERRLEDGPKFEQAKAKGNIKRNVNLKRMQSADSAGQQTLTTELESLPGDSKHQFKNSSVMVDEECFLNKLEGRSERLENEFPKMLQKNELKKSLEEEQQPGARVEEELSRTKTLCTEMEETIDEFGQVRLTFQKIETERYVSVSRERNFQVDDWIIQREEIVLSEEILGTGGWGTVRIGTFRGCQVAVKQLHEVILSDHNRALFAREMRILSTCHHPNLLQFIGATFDDDTPLFVSELLDTSLRGVLEKRPVLLKDTATIALDVAKGLNYLHLEKPFPILHRDVSSVNVLLWRRDERWRAKLGGFGTATLMRSRTTEAPGSMIYSAPETFSNQWTTKVDVYSLGVLLLEMCVHELPFVEKRHDQILKVSSDAIRRLIQQCVSHNPDERPSMKDVILCLSRINQRSMVKSEEQQPKEKMNDLQVKLKNTSIELEKTQVRNKALEKHKQVLQSKHDALLKRVDDLSNECEELRDRVLEAEGEKDKLQGVIKDLQTEKTKLFEQLDSKQNLLEELRPEKETLRREVKQFEAKTNDFEQQLKESEGKLQTVVKFPSIDAKQQKSSSSEESTRTCSLVKTTQPGLMEEERYLLKRSPARNFYDENPNVSHKRPASAIREEQRSYSDHYMSNQIQPRPPEKPRAQPVKISTRARTLRFAETKQSATLSAKLNASGKHAKGILGRPTEGHTQRHEWEHSPAPTLDITAREGRVGREIGRTSPASKRYTPMNVFVCTSCDKMYHTQKDLDIHKYLCYGAVK